MRIDRLLRRAEDPEPAPRRGRAAAGEEAAPPARRPGTFDERPPVPSCPPGWRTGAPDFVIVGAQKAGTTWWFKLIEAHPSVVQPEGQRPELHYFDRLWDTWPDAASIAAYHRYFPRPDGSLAGEKTPAYASVPWVLPMLRAAAPDTRIIHIVRDPVTRYLSGRRHAERAWRKAGLELADVPVGDQRRVVVDAIETGCYARQVERMRALFPAERTLVLQYERNQADPQGQLDRTYAFLGLPPHTLSADELARPRNASTGQPVVVAPEHLAFLRDHYRPDVLRLRTLVPDLDLSLWPSFADLA
ncbi:MAG: sulfotransferase family protein [Chloroflexota bacterium]